MEEEDALACAMNAFTSDERTRYEAHRTAVLRAIVQVDRIDAGARVHFDPALAERAKAWAALEARCCPFLTIDVGPDHAKLTGPPGTWDFLRLALDELGVGE